LLFFSRALGIAMLSPRSFFFLFLLFLGLSAAIKTRWYQLDGYTFKDYVKEFHRSYTPEEYQHRKQIFDLKLESIRAHNNDERYTWKKGVNQFTDRADEEFRRLLGYKKHLAQPGPPADSKRTPSPHLPVSVDWRTKNIITDVKDQGHCGSCWAFASTESIESYWAISTGELSDFSEQNILSCTPNPDDCGGTGGCGGGTAEIAYQTVINNGGIASEWTMPYLSYFGEDFQCQYNSTRTPPVAFLKNYTKLPTNDYTSLIEAVANIGPIAINVDANAWSDYETGLFKGCNQTFVDINHVVQLVGYGGTGNNLYWLIRNSWSPDWGELGYMRLIREPNPPCTLDIKPQDGTGCNGGPRNVSVCGACGILYDTSFPIVMSS